MAKVMGSGKAVVVAALVGISASFGSVIQAQDMLPADNGIGTYHTAPRYRESESHPLRIVGYAIHPIGWLAREVIFRPLSYFAASSETRASIMGYREPFDYRTPECFSADESVPDCRAIPPLSYITGASAANRKAGSASGEEHASASSVYFPDVNFDFDKRALNDLGQGRARQIAKMVKESGPVQIVLQGHADFKGPDQYNEKLGMDRAEALRAELVGLGVSSDKLSTVSFGESQPVFADETDWARAVNRRVEVHVQDKE